MSYNLSNVGDTKKADTKKDSYRDKEMTKAAGLSWNIETVHGIVLCYHRGNRWCIYSTNDAGYMCAETALAQKLESISVSFSYNDLPFDDMYPLSKDLVQKQNLTCKLHIGVSYFNYPERRLRLKDLFIRWGEIGENIAWIV